MMTNEEILKLKLPVKDINKSIVYFLIQDDEIPIIDWRHHQYIRNNDYYEFLRKGREEGLWE